MGSESACMEPTGTSRSCHSGRCAIRGTSEEQLVVVFNHQAGKVRALLRRLCNAMIGCAREDIAILTSAVTYLQRGQGSELEGEWSVKS